MRALLDNLIPVVGVLRRSSIWVPFNLGRNQLNLVSAFLTLFRPRPRGNEKQTWFETKTESGPTSANTPIALTDVTMASTYSATSLISEIQSSSILIITNRLPLERSPDNCPVVYSILCNCAARDHASL